MFTYKRNTFTWLVLPLFAFSSMHVIAFTAPPKVLSNKMQTPPPLSLSQITPTAQNAFFAKIRALCGQSYAGKIKVDTSNSPSFADKKLVMHVRQCSDEQLHIPFHVGADASRTWVVSKTGGGLLLKHDHRHADGSHDDLTMYGGHTLSAGSEHTQAFPTDPYTQSLFISLGYPQSLRNIWEMFIYENTFTYRLTREGLEFRVEFDLSQPVATPMTPWGYP